MTPVLRFHDSRLQRLLGDLVEDGAISWTEFFETAERLRDMDPAELQRLQLLLIDALVEGQYDLTPLPRAPVRFMSDGDGPNALPGTLVIRRHADLPFALADLDSVRQTKGSRATRRMVNRLIDDEGNGWAADRCLVQLLPRSYRLTTGEVMPGYRAYGEEERESVGGREVFRGVLVEVQHAGGRGLLAFSSETATDFQFDDDLGRALEAVRAIAGGVEVVAIRPGPSHPVPPYSPLVNWRDVWDGVVLFRGEVTLPRSDESWLQNFDSAVRRPRRRGRQMPAGEVWALLGTVDLDDLERSVADAVDRVAALTPKKIASFDRGLRQLAGSLEVPAIKEAAEQAFGWLSDDAFEDVRLGIIAAGEQIFAAVLRDPTSIDWAGIPPAEVLLAIGSDAYERRTGGALDFGAEASPSTDLGATALSAGVRDGRTEVCVRWWAAHETAADRHTAAETGSADVRVLAVRPDIAYGELRDEFLGMRPSALL